VEKSHRFSIDTEHLGVTSRSGVACRTDSGKTEGGFEMMSGTTEAALIRNEQLLVQQIIAPSSVNRVFEIAFADPER
jgi:hypothetical protein